jgi:predicted RNase H-like nuclease (RuvC/YqgF family)
MAENDRPTQAGAETPDSLAEKIRDSMLAVEKIRAENIRLTEQLAPLERSKLALESEVESLKIAVENERTERRYYHSLANEIITRLDVVGQTIDAVVRRAEQGTQRQRKDPPAELPEANVPSFLQKVEALINGRADKRETGAP